MFISLVSTSVVGVIIKTPFTLLITCLFYFIGPVSAKTIEFGELLCHNQEFNCLKIKRNNSWSQLFPDPMQRDLVKRINRTNDFLEAGMIIAVPKQLNNKNILDFSPFPLSIAPKLEKLIIIDLAQLAWGAYDLKGKLKRWGPISAGTTYCSESNKGCLTPTGVFHIQRKKGIDCYSKSLPKTIYGESGGAYMPYCMYFNKGYALHGSELLPGHHASHGCVRMLIEDAQWLNEAFVVVANSNSNLQGTKVLIKPY